MIWISRRIASAILALAVSAVPTTALHALPADAEGAMTSWTAAVLDSLAGWFADPRPDPQDRRPAAAAPSVALEPEGNDARPWWDPNGVDALLTSETDARPWWDPNG